jgi:hypothetical protein
MIYNAKFTTTRDEGVSVSEEGLGALKRHPHIRGNIPPILTRHDAATIILVAIASTDVAQHPGPHGCSEVLNKQPRGYGQAST